MTWIVHPGNEAPLEFYRLWGVPAGNLVPLNLADRVREIAPTGWDSLATGLTVVSADTTKTVSGAGLGDQLAMGAAAVVPGSLTITLAGIDSMLFGTPGLRNQREYVSPTGFNPTLFGVSRVYLATIFPVGIAPGAFGTAWISHLDRTITPAGINLLAFGTHQMAGGIREIGLVSRGISSQVFGSLLIAYQSREVFPPFISSMIFGTPTVGTDRFLAPAGIDALAFGLATIKDNKQFLDFAGGIEGAWGTPVVENLLKSVFVGYINDPDEYRFGRAEVLNRLHIVTQAYVESEWNLGGVGEPFLYNRNRVVDLIGNGIAPVFRQIPWTHDVANSARIVRVDTGIDSERIGQHLAAYRDRAVYPEGIVRPDGGFERFTVVYNSAQQLFALGVPSGEAFGTPSIVNTRRYFAGWSAGLQDAYGTPFVAPRIRTLAPYSGFDPLPFPAPSVWFRVREIAPASLGGAFPGAAFGIATLDERFTFIKPASIASVVQFGSEATVRNRTREIGPYHDEAGHSQWGTPAIRTQWRFLPLQGYVATEFGNAYVRDRKTWVYPPSIEGFRANNLHKVRNDSPDPPALQYIICDTGENVLGWGAIGNPSVRSNSIFPEWENDETGFFGTATVRANSILPIGILPPFDQDASGQFGIPSLNNTQFIFHQQQDESLEFPAPSFSPRTIWAPDGAPQQAVDNHNGIVGHEIDAFTNGGSFNRPIFGALTVTNQNRTIFPQSDAPIGMPGNFESLRMGMPLVADSPHYLLPPGWNSFKWGVAILNRQGEVTVSPMADQDAYGMPSVFQPEGSIRYLLPPGVAWAAGAGWGRAHVTNYYQHVTPAGIDALVFGTAWPQFPPPPAYPPGIDSLAVGAHHVGYRIRHVLPQGNDLTEWDWVEGYFALRMRVTQYTPIGGASGIGVGETLVVGTPRVSLRVQGIGAWGIDGSHGVQVPRPALRALDRISVAGLAVDTLEFGEAWALAVQPGQVLVRGDDTAALGHAILSVVVKATPAHVPLVGVVKDGPSDIGHTRVAPAISPAGSDAAQFGDAVVMGVGCGRQARVVGGFETQIVGTPTVQRLAFEGA